MYGPLSISSCALAVLHYNSLRVARHLELPGNRQQTIASQLYDRAFWQLANASARVSNINQNTTGQQTASGYTEVEALAALQLVAYFLIRGGNGDWPTHLDFARDWLAQTGLTSDDQVDPKRSFLLMSDAGRLAARMTMVSLILRVVPVDHLLIIFLFSNFSPASFLSHDNSLFLFVLAAAPPACSGLTSWRRSRYNKPRGFCRYIGDFLGMKTIIMFGRARMDHLWPIL